MNIYKFIAFIIFNLLIFGFAQVKARTYPIHEISKRSCRFSDWSKHSPECKTILEPIKNADYKKYKDDNVMRLTYSVLWWATYNNWWDVWYWSHLWTDIATARWTPVYAIWNWEVIIAWWISWRWNTVVIKHKFKDKYIYSIYAHLSKIVISKWKVKEWTKIWEVWNTGNSWWNHLHFQIDINQWDSWHPYYYSSCRNIKNTVNEWLCRDWLLKNTIDPIVFLETNWANVPDNYQNNIPTEQEKIDPNEIISRQKLLDDEIKWFIKKYNFDIKSSFPNNNLNIWEEWLLSIYLSEKNSTKHFNNTFFSDLELIYDKELLDIFPDKLKVIQNWKRNITIKWKKEGSTKIYMKMGKNILWSISLRILESNSWIIESKNWKIYTLDKFVVWSSNRWLVTIKDNNFKNIIWFPYDWKFSLSLSWDAKICPYLSKGNNIKNYKSFDCSNDDLKKEIYFDYYDTLKWIFLFKIYVYGDDDISLILRKWNNKIWTKKKSNISYPNDLKKDKIYKDYISKAFKNWFVSNYNQTSFAPMFDINQKDAVLRISKTFDLPSIIEWSKYKKLSRLEFMKILSQITWIYSNNDSNLFWDISDSEKIYANIFLDYNLRFLDRFWERYFQPNKIITRWEAAYVLYNLWIYFLK